MNSIVIYASHFGNTRTIAEAFALALREHGAAQLLSAEEAPSSIPQGTDLVVIGGPTEGHTMTPSLATFLDRQEAETLREVAVASFDTRIRWPRWLSGSASVSVAHRLKRAGVTLIAPPESFFVGAVQTTSANKSYTLEPGEAERAAVWANSLVQRVESAQDGAAIGVGEEN
jgi:menaquinone-dependent protoporphyrinogen IX oxidase